MVLWQRVYLVSESVSVSLSRRPLILFCVGNRVLYLFMHNVYLTGCCLPGRNELYTDACRWLCVMTMHFSYKKVAFKTVETGAMQLNFLKILKLIRHTLLSSHTKLTNFSKWNGLHVLTQYYMCGLNRVLDSLTIIHASLYLIVLFIIPLLYWLC